jgi:hypothetical protein
VEGFVGQPLVNHKMSTVNFLNLDLIINLEKNKKKKSLELELVSKGLFRKRIIL